MVASIKEALQGISIPDGDSISEAYAFLHEFTPEPPFKDFGYVLSQVDHSNPRVAELAIRGVSKYPIVEGWQRLREIARGGNSDLEVAVHNSMLSAGNPDWQQFPDTLHWLISEMTDNCRSDFGQTIPRVLGNCQFQGAVPDLEQILREKRSRGLEGLYANIGIALGAIGNRDSLNRLIDFAYGSNKAGWNVDRRLTSMVHDAVIGASDETRAWMTGEMEKLFYQKLHRLTFDGDIFHDVRWMVSSSNNRGEKSVMAILGFYSRALGNVHVPIEDKQDALRYVQEFREVPSLEVREAISQILIANKHIPQSLR